MHFVITKQTTRSIEKGEEREFYPGTATFGSPAVAQKYNVHQNALF